MTDIPVSLRDGIAAQFHAALEMLRKAIELCPEPLWLAAPGHSPNLTWHIVYHALFYTHFYMAPSDAEFVAWELHRPDYNFLGEIPFKPGLRPQPGQPYTPAETIGYLNFCHWEVDRRTAEFDPEAPSGFSWLPFNKLQLQFYSLRHLAHHTGQLAERLRSQTNLGVPWAR